MPLFHLHWVEQLPQPPQVQLLVQVRVCLPHLQFPVWVCVFPGVQPLEPRQPLHAPQLQLLSQVRVFVPLPQLPHAWLSVCPGEHCPPLWQLPQLPQVQFCWQVRVLVPQLLHDCESCEFGSHTPWLTHVAVPHCPDESHVWRSVPHLAHGPTSWICPGVQLPLLPPVPVPALPPVPVPELPPVPVPALPPVPA